jgi:hypothetical protein
MRILLGSVIGIKPNLQNAVLRALFLIASGDVCKAARTIGREQMQYLLATFPYNTLLGANNDSRLPLRIASASNRQSKC